MYPLYFPALQKALKELNRETRIQNLLEERASDLWSVICSIAADIEKRKTLEQVIFRQIEDNLLKVSNERLSGNQYAWRDRVTFEIEKIIEHRESFRDLQKLKQLLWQYVLRYRETKRQLSLLPEILPSEKTITALKPIIEEGADLLYLTHTIKTEEGILLQPPKQDEVEGVFTLGTIVYDKRGLYPLKLSEQAINKHLLIAGETGIGKTNLVYFLLLQIMQQVPCLIFDFKRDYRYLSQHAQIRVVRWHDLEFNPLQPPPGVPALQWMQAFADVFSQDNALLLGSKGFLIEHLDYVYKQFHNDHPSLMDVLNLLKVLRFTAMQREASYLAVCRNRLKTLAIELPNIVKCRKGNITGELLTQNVVIELDGLGIESQNLIISILLTWIYLYRMAAEERGRLKHIVIFDEAKRIFDVNREKRPIEGIPNIDILTSRVREFGEGLIVADQEWSKLTDSIKANSFVKVIFRLGSGKDIEDAARSIGLERQDFISKLKTGEAIVKMGNLNPFLIQVPYVKVQKEKRDASLSDGKEGCFQLIQPVNEDNQVASVDSGLDKIEKELLLHIVEQPFLSMRGRYQAFGNVRQVNEAKKALLQNGFIREVEVNTGAARIKLLEPTSKAFLTLGMNPRKTWRNGGIEHQYWCWKIAEHYRKKGYVVEQESSTGNGRAIDLVAKRDGKRIAIEVETGKSDVMENIQNCLKAEFDGVIVLATNKRVEQGIHEKIFKMNFKENSKILVGFVTDFLKEQD